MRGRVHVRGAVRALVCGGLIATTGVLFPSVSHASVPTRSLVATAVASNLEFPASFTFVGQRGILYGELASGEIRLLDLTTGADRLAFTVSGVVTEGDQGLLGLALHPHFGSNQTIFAFATRQVDGGVFDEVLRIRLGSGSGGRSSTIYRSPASPVHNGGVIRIGPDGKLYVFLGDHTVPSASQQLDNDFGKILRMNLNGGVPGDNPLLGSHIYAYGFRNSFGMAFDPLTDVLWETENGPECNDEVNRIVAGGNYGWGAEHTCDPYLGSPFNTNQNGPNPRRPRIWYTPTTAPTGVAFCRHCSLGTNAEGRLFFGEFNTGDIRALKLGPQRIAVMSDAVAYHHEPGCILAVEAAPGGALYFSDCNGIYKLALR
jgi:glucose/arabinose dehydrogenase